MGFSVFQIVSVFLHWSFILEAKLKLASISWVILILKKHHAAERLLKNVCRAFTTATTKLTNPWVHSFSNSICFLPLKRLLLSEYICEYVQKLFVNVTWKKNSSMLYSHKELFAGMLAWHRSWFPLLILWVSSRWHNVCGSRNHLWGRFKALSKSTVCAVLSCNLTEVSMWWKLVRSCL